MRVAAQRNTIFYTRHRVTIIAPIISSEDASNYKKRYIRIITGDSASKINIEYNLRTKGIDPFDLYRLNDLDFIYTIGCENGNEHEKRKISSFIIHLEKEKNENMMPRL